MDKEEKVIEEKNPMGLVQALEILHRLRDLFESLGGFENEVNAFNKVFGWIDEMVLLLKKIGGQHG